jgi:cobalt-zinc-cadmium efflux system outer membrane protein
MGYLLSSTVASGQTNSETVPSALPTLRVSEARNTAFRNNWDLLASKSDVDFATAQRIAAGEFPNPALSIGTAKIDTDRSSRTSAGNGLWTRSYDTITAVSQLFEIGGKRASRKASANAGIKAAESRLADARRILNRGVTAAYVNVLLASSNEEILKASAQSLRKEVDIAARRLKAGDISIADQTQIEIAARRLELDARAAEATSLNARIALEVLMGVPEPKGQWRPADTLESLSEVQLPAPEKAKDLPRPDLIAAEAAEQKSEADLHLQHALRIPDPTVSLQYEHEPPDQPNTVGLALSFPLPLWNHNRGGIRAAEAQREQARLAVEKVRAQITADIVSTQAEYRAALERFRVHRDEIQPKSASVVQTVAFAYQNGGASLLDLLVAQRNDNEIRLATAQAAADTAVAVADLKAALNMMD